MKNFIVSDLFPKKDNIHTYNSLTDSSRVISSECLFAASLKQMRISYSPFVQLPLLPFLLLLRLDLVHDRKFDEFYHQEVDWLRDLSNNALPNPTAFWLDLKNSVLVSETTRKHIYVREILCLYSNWVLLNS